MFICQQVNNGFAALRQHIPSTVLATLASPASPTPSSSSRGASKKLSKVETLRLAVEYIRSLQKMLEDHESETKCSMSENSLPEERYFASSQYSQYPIILPTPPPSSEASSSPTPSQSSETSSHNAFTSTVYKQYSTYDNYEPNSPEDEELLLDAIFHWQQTS